MTAIGRTLGGRYLLDEVLGDGGTATVYRARDLQTDAPCAVKVLRPEIGRGSQLRARLQAEAQTMSRLSHPNILRVYAAGEEDDADWIAMELSPDGSVADRVRADGPFSARRAIQIVLQVLAALDAAHAAGVVHRDVKPDNLLLASDGTVRLCDFGIALLDDDTRLTQSGFAMGSLPYMAPEQRVDAHLVGPPVDLYATAATLFYLLTGATPVDLFLAPPSSPRFAGLPEGLVELVRKGTHADPAQRFASASAMSEALAAALPHAADQALPVATDRGQTYSTVPEISRVPTAVPQEGSSMEDLEVRLERDWLKAEGEERRRRARRNARLTVAAGATLVVVVVSVGGRAAMDQWLAQQHAHEVAMRMPLAGTWKGTWGAHQATLELRGDHGTLIGAFTRHHGDGDVSVPVGGAVRGGLVVLSELGAGERGATCRASVSADGRLDGECTIGGGAAPFHLVRVATGPG